MKKSFLSLILFFCAGFLIQICCPEYSYAAAFAFITNNGSNTITTVKVHDNSDQGFINTGSGPFGITTNGSDIYITNSLDNTVSVINMPYGTLVNTYNVGAAPKGIAYNPDSTYLYIANSNDNSVSMINTAANIHETISVGASPLGVALSPVNDFVYVTNNGDDSLSIISTNDNSLFVTLRDHYYINYSGSSETVFDKPFGVTVGSSGDSIYVVNSGSNTLKILNASIVVSAEDSFDLSNYDAADDTQGPYVLSASVDVGNDPRCIVLNPDESYAYVTNYADDTVSVINLSDYTVSDTISVGHGPLGISITPPGDYLYVVNNLDNTVSVIYTDFSGQGLYDKNQVIATVDVGNSPVSFGNFIGGSVPKAPSGLAVSLVGDSGADLTWTDNSDDEIYFRVFRKLLSTGTYSEIARLDPNTTEYSDSGLVQGSNYYYMVCAYNEMGNSPFTNEAYVTTPLHSGCFIATAAYGSLTEHHVQILRDFRDRFLLKEKAGRAFVNFYYKYSPPIADYISRHEFLRAVTRICLLPLIGISWIMLSIGPVSIFLLPVLFILLLIILVKVKKKLFTVLFKTGTV